MTNAYLQDALNDIYEALQEELGIEYGDIAVDVALGYIEDGDAIPARIAKKKDFMRYVKAMVACREGKRINNKILKERYENGYDDMSDALCDRYGDAGYVPALAHIESGAPLVCEMSDADDVADYTEMVEAIATLHRLHA